MEPRRKDLRYKVLFVEDDFTLSQAYTRLFQDKFEVQIIDSGVKAIRCAREDENIDAVVLDYKLPDISGLEVLRDLKESKPDLPIIFVTGHGSEEIAVKSFLNGVRDYLKKPFSAAELLSKIEHYIHLKNRLQENRGQLHQKIKMSSVVSADNQRKLEKAIEYIHKQYSEKINIDTVAKISCLSKRHFSRLFREAFNMTFRDYIIDFRFEKSQEILKNTALSITEISLEVGFFDLTHFERMFKKRCGWSPQQYRRRASNGEPAGQALKRIAQAEESPALFLR